MSTTPIIEARLPKNRLALVSLVAALYAPVAVPLALGLDQLALALDWPQGCPPGADHCPPATVTSQLLDLSYGLLILIIPAVGVAIVSGHVALSRLRYASAPKDRRIVALLGLILGYSTFPVLIALYVLAVLTGAIGIE
jgi:hypothetical protein